MLPIRFIVLASLVAAASLIAVEAATQMPDPATPAEENVCFPLSGDSLGHCTAYCEAMDCDSDAPNVSPAACSLQLERYMKVSGALMPCLDEDGDGVPNGDDNCPFVVNDQTNSDALPAGDACQCGDVNTDFVVNAIDVQLVREQLVDVTSLSGPFDPTRCNVIGLSDGGVTDCDVSDVFVLQRFVDGQTVTVENTCDGYLGP